MEPIHYRITPTQFNLHHLAIDGQIMETLEIEAKEGIYHVFITRQELRRVLRMLTMAIGPAD